MDLHNVRPIRYDSLSAPPRYIVQPFESANGDKIVSAVRCPQNPPPFPNETLDFRRHNVWPHYGQTGPFFGSDETMFSMKIPNCTRLQVSILSQVNMGLGESRFCECQRFEKPVNFTRLNSVDILPGYVLQHAAIILPNSAPTETLVRLHAEHMFRPSCCGRPTNRPVTAVRRWWLCSCLKEIDRNPSRSGWFIPCCWWLPRCTLCIPS
ncbi:hypothetical protein HD806DRAFT_335302 [Xylariaceae sp. AK1471]|nr:hypothetical protein HD806DRAFT_335302 [Xylariaceae sp. AK1471]